MPKGPWSICTTKFLCTKRPLIQKSLPDWQHGLSFSQLMQHSCSCLLNSFRVKTEETVLMFSTKAETLVLRSTFFPVTLPWICRTGFSSSTACSRMDISGHAKVLRCFPFSSWPTNWSVSFLGLQLYDTIISIPIRLSRVHKSWFKQQFLLHHVCSSSFPTNPVFHLDLYLLHPVCEIIHLLSRLRSLS